MSAEKHKSNERHPHLKWLHERVKNISDKAMKLGFGAAGVGALLMISGGLAGAAVPMAIGYEALNYGVYIGVVGFLGRLIAGKPSHGHGGH